MPIRTIARSTLAVTLTLGCGAAPAAPSEPPSSPVSAERRERDEPAEAESHEALFAELSRGVWGWPEGAVSCDANPHAISFSEDRRVMWIAFAHATDRDGSDHRRSTYDVTLVGDDFVRGQIRGETRRTSDGKRVVWDLRLLSEDAYCWHRTDWPAGSCTATIRRCPGIDSLPTGE